MPSIDPNVQSVSCPGCGAHYDFPVTMSGRRGRCAKCGTMFAVPATADQRQTEPSTSRRQPAPEPAATPQYVPVECRVCQTLMYGRLDQVGKKLKCPDCGALSVVPPPTPPKKPNIPAALEGEQYELWDADEQPLPSELISHQPKYIAVTCRKCATLMYAAENQVGQTIACPDCGTKHVVPAPPKPNKKVSVLTGDADTPVIDWAADPGERPAYVPQPATKMDYEQRQEVEYARAVEKSRRTGKPMEIDTRGRPIMPRWPLVTGIVPFLFSRGVPVRWLGLSAGLIFSGSMLLEGLKMASSGGMGALAGMCIFAAGCILTIICAAAAASVLLAIITESSEGNREIQVWPFIFDWFSDLMVLGVAAMVSAFPGWAIGKIPALELDASARGLIVAGSILAFLPVILMSQLDFSSPWGVLSGRVLATIRHCPFSWLLFYVEIILLAAACGGAAYFVARQDPGAVVWLMPLYLVASLLFARLLGRLGWRLAEAIPARD